MQRVKKPTYFIVLAEAALMRTYVFDYDISYNRLRWASDPAVDTTGKGIQDRHNNGANFLFWDGHVEWYNNKSDISYDGNITTGPWRKYWLPEGE